MQSTFSKHSHFLFEFKTSKTSAKLNKRPWITLRYTLFIMINLHVQEKFIICNNTHLIHDHKHPT